MNHWLYTQAMNNPERIALITGGLELTFGKLYSRAQKVSGHIAALNLPQRIAVQPHNQLSSVIIMHGLILAGREVVTVNTHLTESEVMQQLSSIQVEVLITDRQYTAIHSISPESLLLDADEDTETMTTFEEDDILSIMFTSGTTGVQKAVPQTFRNHYASAKRCRQSFPYDEDSRWLLCLPLYHISAFSILLRSAIEGFTIVLFEKFDAVNVLASIKDQNITHISLVPQTLEWLLDAGLERHQLQGLLIGGAKMDERTLEKSLERELPIYTSFGMTETCSQFITATPEDIAKYPNSVGRVTPDIKVAAPLNGAGEILVKGDNVMNGYLYPQQANATSFTDGFFMTGDVGRITNGCLYVLDRRRDLIISGGENIYPSEIEQVVLALPAISACAVVPIEDDKWGQRPALVYEAPENMDDEIRQVIAGSIAKYKHPVMMKRAHIARTSNGKISRHRVREWLLNEIQ
ncbi:o-succinylbenzoate--CoA ligase [Macrococcus equipercicus]|uniref:2-succinylbenzoate--CoA ligase n=1 Tax=Macrococcus equipercicus TaxID=69967 RepID=A0ABQ6R7L8_9STAP|nr:o-succinylbenzoate--CoA ligase [Macrococcus equipercicus]KAA1039094.1 o-succinylbenzoate--CoA ligase [Macrococcus equipercicus]